MQPDCDLLPIKRTFVSQSKRLLFIIYLFIYSHLFPPFNLFSYKPPQTAAAPNIPRRSHISHVLIRLSTRKLQREQLGLPAQWARPVVCLTSDLGLEGGGESVPPPSTLHKLKQMFQLPVHTPESLACFHVRLSTFNSCIVWKHTAADDLQLCF